MSGLQKAKASSEDEKIIKALSYGAIKYGYLKFEPHSPIYFDLDATISINGDTGIYLQYAYARMMSILKKAEGAVDFKQAPDSMNPSEASLIRKLVHYPETVELAAEEFKPNHLCRYLFELSQTFNLFYEQCSVLKEPHLETKTFRLQLITSAAQVLKNGLHLLGIETPEEM